MENLVENYDQIALISCHNEIQSVWYKYHNGIWYLKQTNVKLKKILIMSIYHESNFNQWNHSWVSVPA